MLLLRKKPLVIKEVIGRRAIQPHIQLEPEQARSNEKQTGDRRSGRDRRARPDRRSGKDRRNPAVQDISSPPKNIVEKRGGIDRRSGYDRRDFEGL